MASYSDVDANIVRVACEAYLANRDRHIAAVRESIIERKMRPYNLLGFQFGAKTREQAIAELENDMWSEYRMIQIQGERWAIKVRELLALCKVAGADTVKLSAEDARLLQDFIA